MEAALSVPTVVMTDVVLNNDTCAEFEVVDAWRFDGSGI